MSNIIKSHYSNIVASKSIKLTPILMHSNETDTVKQTVHTHTDIEEELNKAKHEAETILQEANNYKNEIVEQLKLDKQNWLIEKESLKETAYQEGYNLGFEKGYEEGELEAKNSYEALIQEAKKIVQLSKVDYLDKLDSVENEMVAIAVKVAEKIIAHTLNKNDEIFVDFVQFALKEVKEKDEIKIFVHPSKFSQLMENKQMLQSVINNLSDIFIIADSELQSHACIIDSSAGRLDVSVDTQLSIIKENLLRLVQQKDDMDL